jgi:integrase
LPRLYHKKYFAEAVFLMVGSYFNKKDANEIAKIATKYNEKRKKYISTYNYKWDTKTSTRKTIYGNSPEECHAMVFKFQQDLIDGKTAARKEAAKEKSKNMTIEQACKLWLTKDVQGVCRSATLRSYLQDVRNYIIPYLGDVKCKELGYIELENWIEALKKTGGKKTGEELSVRTVKGAYNRLSRVMEYIIERECLSIPNPCFSKSFIRKINKKFVDRKKEKVTDSNGNLINKADNKPFSIEEAKHFAEHIFGNNLRLAPTFLLSLCYGLRPGEALGVKFSDINSAERTLSIQRDICRMSDDFDINTLKPINVKLREDKTKSENSERTLFISDAMLEILDYHKEILSLEREYFGNRYKDNDYVTCTRYGTATEPRNYNRMFSEVMDKIGMKNKVPHNLRSTYATILRNETEVDTEVIGWLLGHSTQRTVTDIYIGKRSEFAKENFYEKIKPFMENEIEKLALRHIAGFAQGKRRYKR